MMMKLKLFSSLLSPSQMCYWIVKEVAGNHWSQKVIKCVVDSIASSEQLRLRGGIYEQLKLALVGGQ